MGHGAIPLTQRTSHYYDAVGRKFTGKKLDSESRRRRHESPARYCSGEWSILPSVVWTEGWGTSVPFSALSPSVLRVNPQVFMPVERLQILGHRKTTKCPTLPAPKPRGRREGLGTPCDNCAMNYCGGIISRCAGVKRDSAGTARATRHPLP